MKNVRNLVIVAVEFLIADREAKLNMLSARLQTESVVAYIKFYKEQLRIYKDFLHELQTTNIAILSTGYIFTDE
jgi:hypothetical protein